MFKSHLLTTRTAVISFFCVATIVLASCQVYRPDLQQGQQIERENVDKIQQGMEPAEVLEILGTPLVVDPFHRNRWDYVYYLLNEDREVVTEANVTIHFFDGKVSEIIHSLPEVLETEDDTALSEAGDESEVTDVSETEESAENQVEESAENQVEESAENQVEESAENQVEESNEASEESELSEASEESEVSEAKKEDESSGGNWFKKLIKKFKREN